MAAYYNEIDRFAAAWLRELIKAGLIADGEVDERSIADVAADDVRGFTQCHWFAGIGGWSYALRLAGWPDDRAVWTGSCPCQPFSAAGKGDGAADPRHLWPTWFRLIAECRPATVFGEQVASIDGLAWFDRVSTDLEEAHYAIAACDLPAAGVAAPHQRQRLWFVADTNAIRFSRKDGASSEADQARHIPAYEQTWRAIDDSRRSGVQPHWPAGPCGERSIPPAIDGIPATAMAGRNAAGNAIVPQVAAAFIEAYEEARTSNAVDPHVGSTLD
jgi:DNA (cytosine-5)-methyltransferase 1